MFQEKLSPLAFLIILLKYLQSLRKFISNSEVRYIVISKTSTTLLLNMSSGRCRDWKKTQQNLLNTQSTKSCVIVINFWQVSKGFCGTSVKGGGGCFSPQGKDD